MRSKVVPVRRKIPTDQSDYKGPERRILEERRQFERQFKEWHDK